MTAARSMNSRICIAYEVRQYLHLFTLASRALFLLPEAQKHNQCMHSEVTVTARLGAGLERIEPNSDPGNKIIMEIIK
jgi:hypothetical protein